MTTIEITPQGEFSLRASIGFLEGFTPARYGGSVEPGDARMRVAFPAEGDWQTVGAVLGQRPDGTVHATLSGAGAASSSAVRGQLARMLSLDVDGRGFASVRERDDVVDRLAGAYPGLRPVCFHTPYEAACWAVIGHRIRMTTAAVLKERIAADHGETLVVDGVSLAAFPSPQRLLEVASGVRLPEVKRDRLRAVATAALAGDLDAAHLRALDPAEALARLQRIAGIGLFSAELILVRGAGAPDVFPTQERRLHAAMAERYHLDHPTPELLAETAAPWSPYRSWVSLLFRVDAGS